MARVEEFLAYSNCSLNFFLAWTTAGDKFTLRYRRTLESTLKFHPMGCVVVYSPTLSLDYFQVGGRSPTCIHASMCAHPCVGLCLSEFSAACVCGCSGWNPLCADDGIHRRSSGTWVITSWWSGLMYPISSRVRTRTTSPADVTEARPRLVAVDHVRRSTEAC
jgi:hypothetical protein